MFCFAFFHIPTSYKRLARLKTLQNMIQSPPSGNQNMAIEHPKPWWMGQRNPKHQLISRWSTSTAIHRLSIIPVVQDFAGHVRPSPISQVSEPCKRLRSMFAASMSFCVCLNRSRRCSPGFHSHGGIPIAG